MFIVKVKDNKPEGNLISIPNFVLSKIAEVTLPENPTNSDLEPLGYALYEHTDKPSCTRYQKVIEVDPVINAEGTWQQTWSVVDLSEADRAIKDEIQKELIDTTINANIDFVDSFSTNKKNMLSLTQRNKLLQYKADWEAVKNHPDYPWITNEVFPAPLDPVVDLTPPSVVPRVSMRQARIALLNNDLLDSVETSLNAISDETERKKALIEWEYGTEVDRESQLVASLKTSMSLTEEQLDSLFTEAATI